MFCASRYSNKTKTERKKTTSSCSDFYNSYTISKPAKRFKLAKCNDRKLSGSNKMFNLRAYLEDNEEMNKSKQTKKY